jgi:lysophospholipase L1-like esterase
MLMKILTFGGCHTYAYGIENANNGYLQQYVEHLRLEHQDIEIKSYAPISLKAVIVLIEQKAINLDDYDLIIFQLGNNDFELKLKDIKKQFELSPLDVARTLKQAISRELTPQTTEKLRSIYYQEKIPNVYYQFLKKQFLKPLVWCMKLSNRVSSFPKMKQEIERINELLTLCAAHNEKVVCISPFSSYFPLMTYVRGVGETAFRINCDAFNIKYIDIFKLTKLDKKYFLGDGIHMNEKGHNTLFQLLRDK